MICSIRAIAIVTAIATLSGCGIVYKLPTYQGNYIDQEKVDQLEIGMTPEQVRFLLGTPLIDDVTTGERWDYVAYYRGPRGKESRRVLTVHFADGVVSMIDGKANPWAPPATEAEDPDLPETKKRMKRPAGERVEPPPRPDTGTPRPAETTSVDDSAAGA